MGTTRRKYRKVSSRKVLTALLKKHFNAGQLAALDFETTALRPADGRVRLVSIHNNKVSWLVDFDQMRGGFNSAAKLFKHGRWVVFNAGFELRWFIAAKCPKTTIIDLANMRRAVLGGGNYSLKQVIKWDLDIDMDKEEQTSNWAAKKLTRSQLDYAFGDALHTWNCFEKWAKDQTLGQWECTRMFDHMVPAVIEMEDTGLLLDPKHHAKLVRGWEETRDQLFKIMREHVPPEHVFLVTSDAQWGDYFSRIIPDSWLAHWPRTEKAGQLSMKSEHLKRLAGRAHGTPLETVLDALADFKTVTKYLSSFGQTLINTSRLSPDGRLHARVNIAAAKTGRFSTSSPNVQQVPRNKDIIGEPTSVRRSFIASRGNYLVSLDYSGIELRVLALLSGDQQLLDDMINGDVHSEVASVIAKKKIDRKTKAGKEARQAAKAVSFGIIYGSGAGGLSATMRTSHTAAQSYIDFWQDRYPDAFDYRFRMKDEANMTGYIKMVDGGTVYMSKRAPLPKCANYPVQRAALSVMAHAIARHKTTLDVCRDILPHLKPVRMLATIHDALIDEAPWRQAQRVLGLMSTDMIEGYLDVFPGAPVDRLVEGGVGKTWGDLA